MSEEGRAAAGVLARYAALRRARRKARRRERFDVVRFRDRAREVMVPGLIEGARSRLPACAGPFHKGTLTLNALSGIAGADPAAAARLIERYRRLLALRRSLEG